MQAVNNIFKMNEDDLTPNMSKYTMHMKPSDFSNSKNKKYDKYNCFVTCRNMRKTHYVLKINMLWESSSVIKSKVESDTLGSFNNTYEFKRPIVTKRYPDIVQSFAFEVYDLESKKVLGYARFDFTRNHKEKDFLVTLPIVDEETEAEIGHLDAFFSKCEKSSRNFVGIEASGKDLLNVDGAGDKSDPFLVFHRLCQNKIYVPIHCTTAIMDELNPKWEKVMLAVDELCAGNYESPIKIECWDWQEDYRNQFIGETVTTLQEILSTPTLTLLARDGKKKTGELMIKVSTKLVKPAPTEFLTTQDKFAFVLGIDFSEYNKKPHNKRDLHGMDRKDMTPYLKALEEIGKIMWGQDADGKIPCFGFGGIPSYPDFKHDRTHSLIPLSGNNHKMSILSPQKLTEAYKNALRYIHPTNAPMIADLMNLVKSWCIRDINENLYYVLIILTAGHIEELQKTIDILVDIANLPVSVVFVGLGEYDFGTMEKLDGDKRWLRNSKKKLISRDIVNFVDYEEFGGNSDKFSKKLLEEFPEQFMSYKLLSGYKPKFKAPQ